MSKIGFFGGCFNPPTIAHFNIVKRALSEYNLDKVVIVPMGDMYEKKDLISFNHRYNMLKRMFENEKNVEISNMQENQKKISYAIDSFKLIDGNYKNDERFFIMGKDNFSKIETWKDGKNLVLNRNFIVFDRNNNTSSTLVRKKIKANENFKELVLPEIVSYIEQNGLYK